MIHLLRRVAQNVAHFFLHAATIASGPPLQAGFHAVLEISYYKLRHYGSSTLD
jgi:hypothetical protein